ncbi:hypothetical protein FQA39_LY06528 [Lamprigera yunnana]|nr:hypothetical protein FQA39_LY06528 [Lamprigera yunnana]
MSDIASDIETSEDDLELLKEPRMKNKNYLEMIKWSSDAEKCISAEHFQGKGFPNVIGAIDGNHIKIDKPENDPDSYINRKGIIQYRESVSLQIDENFNDGGESLITLSNFNAEFGNLLMFTDGEEGEPGPSNIIDNLNDGNSGEIYSLLPFPGSPTPAVLPVQQASEEIESAESSSRND